ncbi:MAG: hypothetical protein FWC23_10240, partial [Chitinispirillia bacterium]|nr:hypothetical protein [Chitinispirillia bacterium]MCL2269547.1 hypothetical protein [Chitinispirillia bacterium]
GGGGGGSFVATRPNGTGAHTIKPVKIIITTAIPESHNLSFHQTTQQTPDKQPAEIIYPNIINITYGFPGIQIFLFFSSTANCLKLNLTDARGLKKGLPNNPLRGSRKCKKPDRRSKYQNRRFLDILRRFRQCCQPLPNREILQLTIFLFYS